MRPAYLTVALIALPALCQNVPMFRGNPQHTGVYDGAGARKFNQIQWKFKTNGKVIASPAVANGKVYFGSTDQYLYAVDQQTGALLWKFQTGSVVTSSPAVANGLVYFGSFDSIFTPWIAPTDR